MITKGRKIEDARAVFQDGKEKMPYRPIAVIHDGLEPYSEAFKKEFYVNQGRQTFELRSVSIREKARTIGSNAYITLSKIELRHNAP